MPKHCIHQVVNMEWGNFWSSHLPRTPYDISLDDETQNRNDQVSNLCTFQSDCIFVFCCQQDETYESFTQGFEKMISGMYLGEIARLVLHRMAQESDVFGDATDSLSTPFILRYCHVLRVCFSKLMCYGNGTTERIILQCNQLNIS